MTETKENIDSGRNLVGHLLNKPRIPFSGRTVDELPDESGIILFSNGDDILYIGLSYTTIKNTVKYHWDGATASDLSGKLVAKGCTGDKRESRDWIMDNVDIRCMTSLELDMGDELAKELAIEILNPKLNG